MEQVKYKLVMTVEAHGDPTWNPSASTPACLSKSVCPGQRSHPKQTQAISEAPALSHNWNSQKL